MREYSEAIADKSAPAHWPDDTLQANAAKEHAGARSLQAEAVYDWANRHGVNLFAEGHRVRRGHVLLYCVLSDKPIKYGEDQMP